jgi:CHAT domain-containing protein/Tfp pilus assembly protein PilF
MLTLYIPRKRSSVATREGSKTQNDNPRLVPTTHRRLRRTHRAKEKAILVCGALLLLGASAYSATTRGGKPEVAEGLIVEANGLRVDWTEASLRKALANYDEAARGLLASGERRSGVIALMKAGEVSVLLGEYREALDRYRRASIAANAAHADLEATQALSETGRLYSLLGDTEKAKTAVTEALEFFTSSNQKTPTTEVKTAQARALSNLAEVQYSSGNLLKASENFRRARDLFVEVSDKVGEARTHLFLGYVAGSLGEADVAPGEIAKALALYRAADNKSGEGLCLTALGISYSQNREADQAIKLHTEARDIFRLIGDRQSEGITLMGMGQVYDFLNDYQTALEKYQEALRLFQAKGNVDFASVAMCTTARVYRLSGDNDRALSVYQDCLKLSHAAKKTRTEANALSELALVYAAQGKRDKTLAQYRKALKFYAAIGDRRRQAKALNNLGDFYSRIGERANARALYEQAQPLGEQAGDQGVVISTLYNLARVSRDAGDLDDSLSYIKRSIELIEQLRANVTSPDYRTTYFSGVLRNYELEIDVLMQLDRQRPGRGLASQAFLASENARARSLIDLVIESRADIRQGVSPGLLQRERELQGLIRSQAQYQMDLKVKGNADAESDEVRRGIEELKTRYEQLESQLRDGSRLSNLTRKAPLDLQQIQSQLDENTILLEYTLGDERSYLWAVTRNSLGSYELPARNQLEDAARETYKALTARQEFEEKADGSYQQGVEAADASYEIKAATLSRLLLGPITNQLGTKRLIVVTEGVLQSIPFDALPVLPSDAMSGPGVTGDSVPLIASHEVIVLPSFSTLTTIRENARNGKSPDRIVAVLADPVFTASDDRVVSGNEANIARADFNQADNSPALRDFPSLLRNGSTMRLVHASEEADTIMSTVPRGAGIVAKGFDANRETATNSLVGQYQIVHFATHSFLNSQHPELSGVVLSRVNRDGSSTDGFIGLQDIYRLNLSANLVVLSACDTALGKDIEGEGLVGLAHAFMSAGSKSVVASLWKVDDRATAALMAEFYRAMLRDGLPPAAALRTAKQKIRQQKMWSAPYYWAGFVLEGEYKDPIVVRNSSWRSVAIAVPLALVLTSSAFVVVRKRRNRRKRGA